MARIFVCGPTEFEIDVDAFVAATKELRSQGHTVPGGETLLRNRIESLLACDELALLPGWTECAHARLEHRIAQALQMPIRTVGGEST